MYRADSKTSQPTSHKEKQRSRSTVPHQNAVSDVHNQVMVAIRGKAYNAMSVNAAERANRCAEVRLKNTKKHIEFMQHLDLVRLNRDKLQMMDRLEKFKKSLIKIRADKSSVFRRESMASKQREDFSTDSNRDVCVPILSQHSPRFRSETQARYVSTLGTKLKPLSVSSAPNNLLPYTDSFLTPQGIIWDQVAVPMKVKPVEVCNFPRRFDVIPNPRFVDSASMAQAFRVVTLKGSRKMRDHSVADM